MWLAKINAKQLKFIELMLTSKMTQKEIANEIGVDPSTLSQWKKNDDIMSEYDKGIKRAIRYAAKEAFEKQIALLKSKNEMIVYMVSRDILERGGYKADKLDNTTNDGGLVILPQATDASGDTLVQ